MRWVVDTHFHWDHYQGNEAYPSAWPAGVEIIASQPTRQAIESRGVPRVRFDDPQPAPGDRAAARGGARVSTALADQARLDAERQAKEAYLGELRAMQVTLPSLTFEKSLVLYRPSRTVHILWLGRGHTDGDVVVYVPQEKVLMTGDLIHGWMPWMGDSHPYDWIETLAAAERLDFDRVLSGHGEVLRGQRRLPPLARVPARPRPEAAKAYGDGASLAEARTRVAGALRARYAPAFGAARFEDSVRGNVDRAYRVVSGKME